MGIERQQLVITEALPDHGQMRLGDSVGGDERRPSGVQQIGHLSGLAVAGRQLLEIDHVPTLVASRIDPHHPVTTASSSSTWREDLALAACTPGSQVRFEETDHSAGCWAYAAAA